MQRTTATTEDEKDLQQQMVLKYALHRHCEKISQFEVGMSLAGPGLQLLQHVVNIQPINNHTIVRMATCSGME